MKRYWVLAIGAFFVLAGAAVILGGLNQDEGWYLYAANLVAKGEHPYRDFFFTQGPVMPYVYSCFSGIWSSYGLLGARVFTLALGFVGVLFAVGIARRSVSDERKNVVSFVTFVLLATNLYHLYYLAIPKTYALASLFVLVGFYLLTYRGVAFVAFAGAAFALATGTRISLGAILPVVAIALLLKRSVRDCLVFSIGAVLMLAAIYLPIVFIAREGFISSLTYHSARGGSNVVWTVGSVSRLVRWYLPAFVLLGIGTFRQSKLLFMAFLAVFAVQIVAPFPYEDYQVPIMALLAVFAAINLNIDRAPLLALGLTFAVSFGSPLLQDWMTNGQDRFWSIKKNRCELLQLRDVARDIERLDPQGKTLLTQDLYLAVETNRQVPKGLEMGPFSMLTDDEWRALLKAAPETCPVAALSGYTFAIEPPACTERSVKTQLDYWMILKEGYEKVFKIDYFGQHATTLMVLKRK